MADHLIKARKRHACRFCGEVIQVGESSWFRTGFNSDGPWTVHFHPECEPLTRKWRQEDWETYVPGDHERPVKTS